MGFWLLLVVAESALLSLIPVWLVAQCFTLLTWVSVKTSVNYCFSSSRGVREGPQDSASTTAFRRVDTLAARLRYSAANFLLV